MHYKTGKFGRNHRKSPKERLNKTSQ